MANLIDRDSLMAQLEDRQAFLVKEWGYRDHYTRGFEEAADKVGNAPSVDAVEVVRCKDCKHGIWNEEEQMWECIVEVDLTGDADTYAMFHEYNHGDHFCSYGERKDNG